MRIAKVTRIEPVSAAENISRLYIKENKKVFSEDFLLEMHNQIEERNTKTELLNPNGD
jgi:hypothetical protein